MQKNICALLLLLYLGLSTQLSAQIDSRINGNEITVKANGLPALIPLPGAPAPRRGYLWIFSDGSYSRQAVATHRFDSSGTYGVALYTNDGYTTGGPPPPGFASVTVSGGNTNGSAPLGLSYRSPKLTPTVQITSNRISSGRSPLHTLVPDEQTVMIISYGNNTSQAKGPGNVIIGYNPKAFRGRVCEVDTLHYHHRERVSMANRLPRRLPQNMRGSYLQMDSKYKDFIRIQYNGLAPGEQRNVFLVLRTLADADDQYAIDDLDISVAHVFEGNTTVGSPYKEEGPLLLARAEDPNRILVDERRMAWRRSEPGYLEYTVQFQNEGNGAADSIRVEVATEGSFDFSQLELVDWYPPAPRADKFPTATSTLSSEVDEEKGQVVFTFDNVYLPGMKKAGGVAADSTQGFVTFRVPTSSTFARNNQARANIVFNREEAIETNQARTRLLRAYRPKILVGASFSTHLPKDISEAGSHPGLHIEIALDRYKPKGWYVVPHLSTQRNQVQNTDASLIYVYQQISGSILNLHANPLRWAKVGFGLTGHLLLAGSEQAVEGVIESFASGSPLGFGYYTQASAIPFRRGPEVYLRGQFQYVPYFDLIGVRPELYQIQIGLGYTF